LNTPGSWNDARLFRDSNLVNSLATALGPQHFVIADSIFPSDGPNVKRCLKQNQMPSSEEEKLFYEELVSARQSAEWGMRGLQAAWPRLKSRFWWEQKGLRQKVLSIGVHLHNYRCREVGLNQIRSYWFDE
jgi:hypothetical protein